MRGVLAALFILAALCGAALPARADAYTDALARFATDSYADTEAGIEGVAASGNALAAEVISALQAGRLAVRAADKAVFIRDAAGALKDARTGEPATVAAADLKAVRLNNRVRRAGCPRSPAATAGGRR